MDNFHVLLVDDEEELVLTLIERLAYRGITADYATSGDKAIEKFGNSSYDIVVIDLKLPGMSGEELLRYVKKSHPHLPVLMITGHGSGHDGTFSKPDGVYDLLPKPIDISELIKIMRKAIDAKQRQ